MSKPAIPQPDIHPGFRWPEELSMMKMYEEGVNTPCGEWAIYDFWEGGRTRMECFLPFDHEDNYGLPHVSYDKNRAWRNGVQYDLWFKDKASDPAGEPQTTAQASPQHQTPTNKEGK
jgi:hypothetical protein